jgi:hypothetical protein
MRKLMLLLCLTISPICNAQLTAGYLTGFHVGTPKLNNHHPFIEFSDTVLVYRNSFDKLSVAGYYKWSNEYFAIRTGVTTGYREKIYYKGDLYEMGMLAEGLTLFFVPSLEIKKGDVSYVIAILGNSLNFGVGISF